MNRDLTLDVFPSYSTHPQWEIDGDSALVVSGGKSPYPQLTLLNDVCEPHTLLRVFSFKTHIHSDYNMVIGSIGAIDGE